MSTQESVYFLKSKTSTNYKITKQNEKNNGYQTDWTNADLTKAQRIFMQRATLICTTEHRPFCFLDFQLSPGNFRQKILELKLYIEKVCDGRPCFYKIKGVDLPLGFRKITLKPMGVNDLDRILADLKEQPATIHDLKLRVESDLHDKMIKQGFSVNPKNHCIVISGIQSPDPNLSFKVLVYKNHFQLDVGCSYKPLIYSFESLLNLVFYFGQYLNSLRLYVKDYFSIQPVSHWTITHYHFGKDGNVELNGQSFHFKFNDLCEAITRLYSKHYPDGSTFARVESIQTPRKTIEEKMMEVLPEVFQTSTVSSPTNLGTLKNDTKEVN